MSNNPIVRQAILTMFGLMRSRLSTSQMISYAAGVLFSHWSARRELKILEKYTESTHPFRDELELKSYKLLSSKIAYEKNISIDEVEDFFTYLENTYPDDLKQVLSIILKEARLLTEKHLFEQIYADLGRMASSALDASSTPTYSDVFDEFLDESAKQLAHGYAAPNFSTPSTVCNLISRIVGAQYGETVYDPCMGSGNLLIQCASSNEKNTEIFGFEPNQFAWALAKLNSIVHGYSSSNLHLSDVFNSPHTENIQRKFDIIVSNPPWGVKLNAITRRIAEEYGLPSKGNADYLFIWHMISNLEESKGRMAVIVSNGALSRVGDETKIRQRLYEYSLIDSVIALPGRLFENTNVAASILILNKSSIANREVFFIDARGMAQTSKRTNFLPDAAVARIFDIYNERKEIEGISRLVKREELINFEYSLYVPHYVQQELEKGDITLDEVASRIASFEDELREIDLKIKIELQTLNF